MSLTLRHRTLHLPLRDPFRLARALEGRAALSIILELATTSDSGPSGLGEAFPLPYYGESEATVIAVLPRLLAAVEPLDGRLGRELLGTRQALEEAGQAMDRALAANRAAKAGLDIAMHDLAARRLGLPLHALLGTAPEGPPTDFTLGIDAPAVVAQRAIRAGHFPALKIKVGGPADLATLEAVRAVYGGPLRVDANTGWSPEEGERLLPELLRLGVELVEQPFPADRLDQLQWLQERSPLPLVADESLVTLADLDRLQGVVAGVNVKLAKCGGVGPAHRLLTRARELGLRCMLGCMEETSVGIAASAALASLAEWVDLDGCLLLAADPYQGIELGSDCRWILPATPGLGISARQGDRPGEDR